MYSVVRIIVPMWYKVDSAIKMFHVVDSIVQICYVVETADQRFDTIGFRGFEVKMFIINIKIIYKSWKNKTICICRLSGIYQSKEWNRWREFVKCRVYTKSYMWQRIQAAEQYR